MEISEKNQINDRIRVCISLLSNDNINWILFMINHINDYVICDHFITLNLNTHDQINGLLCSGNLPNNVFITDPIPKQWGTHYTILAGHMANVEYACQQKMYFSHVLFMASNCIFYRKLDDFGLINVMKNGNSNLSPPIPFAERNNNWSWKPWKCKVLFRVIWKFKHKHYWHTLIEGTVLPAAVMKDFLQDGGVWQDVIARSRILPETAFFFPFEEVFLQTFSETLYPNVYKNVLHMAESNNILSEIKQLLCNEKNTIYMIKRVNRNVSEVTELIENISAL